jgi:hypothetical protein
MRGVGMSKLEQNKVIVCGFAADHPLGVDAKKKKTRIPRSGQGFKSGGGRRSREKEKEKRFDI